MAVDKFRLEKEEKPLVSGKIRAVKAKNLSSLGWAAVSSKREHLDITWQWQCLDTVTQERFLQAY